MNRKSITYFLGFFFLLFLIVTVFNAWFSFTPLSSGDWRYMYQSAVTSLPIFPSSWSNEFNDGLGGSTLFLLPLQSYFLVTSHIGTSVFGWPWVLLERIVWFWPFLIVSFVSAFYLHKQVFQERSSVFLTIGLFIFNTYSLMLVGGGQLGVAMAYALSPFVFGTFISLLKKKRRSFSWSIFSGLILSLQILLDLRISYITVFAVGAYYIFQLLFAFLQKRSHKNLRAFGVDLLFFVIIPTLTTFFLHVFWLVPYIFYPRGPLGEGVQVYVSSLSVKFFSFADFSHSFTLLQPNWPENIFGKIYFMDPLFIGLPILAHASLFFISTKKELKNAILFFVFLGLIGSFLGKGSNDPFGIVYIWLFDHMPGFVLFRDSTKWYTLTAIAYSVLIPFTVFSFSDFLRNLLRDHSFFWRNFFSKAFVVLAIIYLLSLLLPAFTNKLTGTFAKHEIPNEYLAFATFIEQDNPVFRTLWVPADQRYGYSSPDKQAISAADFFGTNDVTKILRHFSSEKIVSQLQMWGIRYIIVPDDIQKEIFILDRTYDPLLVKRTQTYFASQTRFPLVHQFGNIYVYAVPGAKNLFTFTHSDKQVSWKEISPTSYLAQIEKGRGDLLFAMKYDPFWRLHIGGRDISSQNENGVTIFSTNTMQGEVLIYYLPQKKVEKYFWISSAAFCIAGIILLRNVIIMLKKKR